MFIHTNCEDRNLPIDHGGVSFMDELFPTRCLVSPNEVEETGIWTDYSNIISKHSNICVRYMKNKKV